jgi:guanylate kinase
MQSGPALKDQVVTITRRGLMLVLSSPSGAGKTTLSRLLLDDDKNIELSVSVTTRPRRLSEVDGRDYRFITQREYDAMVRNDELLEWAEVFGFSYGTPKEQVTRALAAGRDMLFDIDWQGTRQLVDKCRQDVVAVFVLPPTLEELERRLHRRAEDSDETIRKRMAKATDELSHSADYDYVVINHDLDRAFAEIRAILAAERRKCERQIGLFDFVQGLQAGSVTRG